MTSDKEVIIIAFISQKGGVGKSTFSQAMAVDSTKQKIKTLLADCDSQQTTSYEWAKGRAAKKIKPIIETQKFAEVSELWKVVNEYELVIIDAPARTSQGTLEIAKRANLIIQPAGASKADLVPGIKEFNALIKAGIAKSKLIFALNHIGSKAEEEMAFEYLKESKYSFLATSLPEKVSFRQVQNDGKSITEVIYKNLRNESKKVIKNILDYI